MSLGDLASFYFWQLFTRLGEAQVVLPAALFTALISLRRPGGRPVAVWWMALLGGAIFVTTASKVAFIGWGVGWPALDFTGVSGHAMFAAAVYPVMFGSLSAPYAGRRGERAFVACGFALALLVGVSRLVLEVHSASEVVAGLLVGGVSSAIVLGRARFPRWPVGGLAVPAVVASMVVLLPAHAPASTTHVAVTQLSLVLSGNTLPYTRADMLRAQPLR